MIRRFFHIASVQKAWLIACIALGALALSAGIFQAIRDNPDGAAGIAGGSIMLCIGIAGLRTLKRKSLHQGF
jgi:hypothetical protein